MLSTKTLAKLLIRVGQVNTRGAGQIDSKLAWTKEAKVDVEIYFTDGRPVTSVPGVGAGTTVVYYRK